MQEVRVRCRPLTSWPTRVLKDHERKPSPFTADWTAMVDLLKREARQRVMD